MRSLKEYFEREREREDRFKTRSAVNLRRRTFTGFSGMLNKQLTANKAAMLAAGRHVGRYQIKEAERERERETLNINVSRAL